MRFCFRWTFLKADGSYFPGKIRENYFRHSGYWFGRYWMCWLNRFWIVILLQCHSEPNLWKTLRKLGGKLQYFRWTFLKANGQYFAGKIQEHYFRYSGCLFGRHWMCWLNRFQNTFGNAFIPKYALPPTCFTVKNWSLDCMYRSYTDDILVWWL